MGTVERNIAAVHPLCEAGYVTSRLSRARHTYNEQGTPHLE
jgi:hypothetical protein